MLLASAHDRQHARSMVSVILGDFHFNRLLVAPPQWDSPCSERGGIPRLMVSRSPSWHPTGFIEPCLPTPSRTMPSGPCWAFEVKHDGFRFICRRNGDRVRVFSRSAKEWTDRVPTTRPVATLPNL